MSILGIIMCRMKVVFLVVSLVLLTNGQVLKKARVSYAQPASP
jgi:hypothetical protein